MTTGERIKAARKKAGMTQKEIAEKAGTATGTIQQYELGKRQPRLAQLQRIAAALGVPVQELIADWSAVDKEEFKRVFIHGEGLEPPARIAVALERLNATGAGKVADYAEDLTHVPRYTAPEPPQGTLAPSEGTDTTPPPDGPHRPPEGQE